MLAIRSDTQAHPDLYAFMSGSHKSLDGCFERLMAAVTADDRLGIHTLWCELERDLLAHLEAEERYVLPAFARTDRLEATALLREHGKIREQLLELGIGVELHTIRLATAAAFIAELRAHAAREDTLLYRWAAERLEPSLRDAARRHIETMSSSDGTHDATRGPHAPVQDR